MELFKFTNDCEVMLSQKINLKDVNKSTKSLWEELMLLNDIKINIEKYDNHDENSIVNSILKADMDEGVLKKRIMDILSGVNDQLQNNDATNVTDDLENNILNVRKIQNYFITDKLWNFLKCKFFHKS